MVPAFTSWVRMPIKAALATSLACVGVLAVPGLITHAALGHINWLYAFPLCVGVVPGARLGAHLTIRSEDRTLRLLVGRRARGHRRRVRGRRDPRAPVAPAEAGELARARASTASSIGSVSRPVKVFCWLGW